MNSADHAGGPEIVRYHTRGIRFPRLIGRALDGTRLPGGPYTITQVIGFVGVIGLGAVSRPLWGGPSMLGDYSMLLAIAAMVGYGLQRLPLGGRSPWDIAVGLTHMSGTPRHGRLDGSRLPRSRPCRVRG